MKSSFLVLVLACSGCGSDPASDGGATAIDAQGTPGVQVEAQPEASAAAPQASTARLVADAKALPECAITDDGALMYAKAEATFYVCSSNAWAAIDLSGKGGAAGKDGVAGKDGEAGKDGLDASSTIWLDPIGGNRWLVGGSGNFDTSLLVCSGAYQLPTCEELVAAGLHGIYSGLHGGASGWCGGLAVANDTYGRIAVIDVNQHDEGELRTAIHAVYCREKG